MARLLEHHAKDILERAGIPTPRREQVTNPADAAAAAARLGGRVVVKALVPANRRAKGGGVLFADDPDDAARAATTILGAVFDGLTAAAVLVEERVEIEREIFFSLLLDRDRQRVIAAATLAGGVDVEQAARRPGGLEVVEVDSWGRQTEKTFHDLWLKLGLDNPDLDATVDVCVRATEVFFQSDASILELNPIGLTGRAPRAVAIGAIIAVDDAALPRQPGIAAVVAAGGEGWRPRTDLELEALDVAATEAHRGTARFIELEGEIGLLSGGGGGSQVVFESVRRAGGRPACFTEIGGNPSAEKVRRLAGIVLSCPGVRGLLVAHNLTSNTQVDLVATGVVAALADRGIDARVFPVVAREAGTNDELGRSIFEEAGIEYLGQEHTLESAARRIVERIAERQEPGR